MKKLLFIFQELLKLFLLFLIFYISLSFYLSSKGFAIILSLSLAAFCNIILHLIGNKKNRNSNIRIKEQREAEQMFVSLAISPSSIEFFLNLFKTRYKNVVKKGNYVLIEHENSKTLFFPYLNFKEFSVDDLLAITKRQKNITRIIISCSSYNKQCLEYIKTFDFEIILLDKYDSYSSLYKEFDYFPVIKYTPKEKSSVKDFLKTIFERKKAKGYIFSAIALLLFSLYIPFSIYYKVTACILLVFAIICLSNKTKIIKELV